MATEQDAARDRVLAAKADLAHELELLEASGRAALDIPARVKRSPAKAAAIVGGIAFLLLKGPQRIFGAARRGITGRPADMPTGMLPDEIEKTLRKMGRDGDKVRGALERDFAAYAKKSRAGRQSLMTLMLLAVVRPLLARGARVASEVLFSPDPNGFSTRLAEVRARAGEEAGRARQGADQAQASAKDRIAAVRRDEPAAAGKAGTTGDAAKGSVAGEPGAAGKTDGPADETAPTGI